MRKLKWPSRLVVIALLVTGQIGCSAGAGAGAGGGVRKPALSKSSRDQLVRAQKATDAQRYAEAIRLCDAVIAAEPDNAEAYKVRGLARMSMPAHQPAPQRPDFWGTRPRRHVEPYWLQRAPARQDLAKAGELRGQKDPVVWYLLSVLHTDIARNSWEWAPVRDLQDAINALEQAEKLDPKNPAYQRAREVLVPQLYFAKRKDASNQMPYNGEYAHVAQMGDSVPYGEVMKRLGWEPGKTWLPPAQRPGYRPEARASSASPSSGNPQDEKTMYILLGIGAVLLMAGLSDRDGGGGGGGGGGGRSGGVEDCTSCIGGQVSDWNHYTGQMTWGPCRSCGGSGVRAR